MARKPSDKMYRVSWQQAGTGRARLYRSQSKTFKTQPPADRLAFMLRENKANRNVKIECGWVVWDDLDS